MTELMIPIERAVRPLRASRMRKLRLREQWLEHLSHIYREEFQRLGNHSVAVAAAVARCPPRAELQQELQSQVPRLDALVRFLEPISPFGKRRHSVLSFTVSTWLISQVVLTLALGLALRLFSGHWFSLELLAVLLVHAVYFPMTVAMFLGMTGARHGVLRQPASPARARWFSLGLFLCVVIFGLTPGLLTGASTAKLLRQFYRSLPMALAFTLVAQLLSGRCANTLRHEQELTERLRVWESLDISERPSSHSAAASQSSAILS